MTGTVNWADGSCTVEANDGGYLSGQLICNYVHSQTGANKTPMSVTWGGSVINHPPPRALLTE